MTRSYYPLRWLIIVAAFLAYTGHPWWVFVAMLLSNAQVTFRGR